MAFVLGACVCGILCASFKSEVSISPSSVGLLQLTCTGLQSQMLWGLVFLQEPRAGEADVGLRTLTPVGGPLQYDFSPVSGLPNQVVWDVISRVCPFCQSHCGSFFMSLAVENLFW